ncbi:MAG: hypothetical protein R2711_18065 [Acidimicrobiales bacterium]
MGRDPLGADEARRAIRAAEVALLDERRMLTADELAAPPTCPTRRCRRSPPSPTRCASPGAGPRSRSRASSGEDGRLPRRTATSARSRRSSSMVVKATPFLDTDEVLEAARETAKLGASEFCIALAIKGPDDGR